MPDDPNDPAVEPETAETAEETTAPSTETAPPWGDDFDPARAWNTITQLREFEKEAKEFKRLQSDEDARREWLTGLGYEFDDGETSEVEQDESDDQDHDPIVSKLSQLEQWQQQQDQEKYQQARATEWSGFGEHISTLASEAGEELSEKDKQRIAIECADKDGWPIGPDKAKAKLQEFLKERDEFRQKVIEDFRKSKKSPHVSPAGKAATSTTALDEMDQNELIKWQIEQVQARAQ